MIRLITSGGLNFIVIPLILGIQSPRAILVLFRMDAHPKSHITQLNRESENTSSNILSIFRLAQQQQTKFTYAASGLNGQRRIYE